MKSDGKNTTDPGRYYNVKLYGVKLDPYRLADLLGIDSHPLFHAWKKIGWSGKRSGEKSKRRDIEEAVAALNRWLEMTDEHAEVAAGTMYGDTE